jgi:hypothetical protein
VNAKVSAATVKTYSALCRIPRAYTIPLVRLFVDVDDTWLTMLRLVLARLRRALDLARLFELPDHHPDRMIAASIVLYVGLGIIIAITVWNHGEVTHQ